MAKDPAFLFYPGDWLGGTMHMTLLEKGAYIELLMLQFSRGKFTEAHAKHLLNGSFDLVWANVSEKFKFDGKYYCNERLESERERRKKFSESRRNNALQPKNNKKSLPASAEHTLERMETATETINEPVLERGIRGEVFSNAEDLILGNQIEFDRICMTTGKDRDQGRAGLRKYHLYLDEKEQYPKTKKALFSGFEKWLMNEKNNKNGQRPPSQVGKTIEFD